MDQYRPVRYERLHAANWEEAALETVAASGLRTLTIPALAESLGVTKGSFYWHFDSIDSLIASALRRWEAADRETLDELAKISDPARRLRSAFEEAIRLERSQALYVTLTATSADPAVAQVLRRVSQRRIRFLAAAYRELGFAPAGAKERALLAYTAYLGMIHLRRQSIEGVRTGRELQAYVAHAERTLIPKRRRSP
ncbi:MAG TPA: helix-turn-helix domain-containing protein [Thermoanaerobaculia bacterium]|nr:helix-turn-helix domain-containing protein [Thermoanaerobaculia bacterium]